MNWRSITPAQVQELLPFTPPGISVRALVAEIEARNPGIDWGRTGAERHVRHRLTKLMQAGAARPVEKSAPWLTWIATT